MQAAAQGWQRQRGLKEKSRLPEEEEGAAVAWTRAGGRALQARDDDGDAVVGGVLGLK